MRQRANVSAPRQSCRAFKLIAHAFLFTLIVYNKFEGLYNYVLPTTIPDTQMDPLECHQVRWLFVFQEGFKFIIKYQEGRKRVRIFDVSEIAL